MNGAAAAVGRFAPSPSGPLHFGSLVAALGSFLAARAAGGSWRLRIEDIDTPRVVPGAADDILRTLEAFGLHWDGAVMYQSRRGDAYQAVLDKLLADGLAYPCSCSRKDIAAVAGASLLYPGLCRRGPRQPRHPLAVRLHTDDTPIGFADRIQGPYQQRLATAVGDFVIRRADGLFAYQLAVVVDDAAQGVTQVVRGADLLDSTPRQIWLQRLLGLPTPEYAHLPLALDRNGQKLSKSSQAPAVERRHPVPALVAALRFLGHAPPAELRAAPPAELLDWARCHWQWAHIPRDPAAPPALRSLADPA
ncbi:MAG TPA: tRNA glutamyl-Q(34) synthetase GluQRS [Candidatus Competibacteraceae bacterium]|nr:tRNA glutamyl-Q(34) synthetase GluQRS [Candidatus Competibacteraceae bacterium]